MPTCPVCEHLQEIGDTCEVCGKVLIVAPRGPVIRVEQMADLEQTHWEEPFPDDPPLMDALEQTAQAPVVATAVAMEDLVRTGSEVGQVSTTALEDIDLGRVPDDGERVSMPSGPVPCRYCKHVQEEGSFCDRCGMRRPQLASAVPTPLIGEPAPCRRCGEDVVPNGRCPGCGMLAPLPEA